MLVLPTPLGPAIACIPLKVLRTVLHCSDVVRYWWIFVNASSDDSMLRTSSSNIARSVEGTLVSRIMSPSDWIWAGNPAVFSQRALEPASRISLRISSSSLLTKATSSRARRLSCSAAGEASSVASGGCTFCMCFMAPCRTRPKFGGVTIAAALGEGGAGRRWRRRTGGW